LSPVASPLRPALTVTLRGTSPAVDRALFFDLEAAEAAEFYASVGSLGRTFIEVETRAFALPA